MEKRLIMAMLLSFLILWTWSAFFSPSPPAPSKKIEQPTISIKETRVLPEKPVMPNQTFAVSLDKYKANFMENSATINDIFFKAYQNENLNLKYGFLLLDKELQFKKALETPESLVFNYADHEKSITKKFNLYNYKYLIELEIKIQNLSKDAKKFELPLILGVLNFAGDQKDVQYEDAVFGASDKVSYDKARKSVSVENLKFLALRSRYFCNIIGPSSGNFTGFVNRLTTNESEIGLYIKTDSLSPGETFIEKFSIYLGPLQIKQIYQANPNWTAVVHYGTFDFISQILLQVLDFLYRLLHNWGAAIILLSIGIYILLFPLTLKQMRAMKQMQVLQPRIEELKKTYKDNPQRVNKEIMELYREHKVNPLGGCLPLVLQIPIFFALYQALIRSVDLKGAAFLWIKDLSLPDRLFTLPFRLPILDNEINILPIIMAIGMFIQQKISMANTGGVSTEQQKFMLILMPVLFGVMFYRMPAGLVLYWFINSTLMLMYQMRINKVKA